MPIQRVLPFPLVGCLLALALSGCLTGSPWPGVLPSIQINVVMPEKGSPKPITPTGPIEDNGRISAIGPPTDDPSVLVTCALIPAAPNPSEGTPRPDEQEKKQQGAGATTSDDQEKRQQGAGAKTSDEQEKQQDAAAKPPATTKADLSQLERDEDPKPAIRLRGRIHTDAIEVTQSLRDKMIFGNLQNAVGFRRARLGAEGEVGEQVNWVAEFDFAGGQIEFKDVFIGVSELPLVRRIRVGHMLEPYSLESQTSSNFITFVERSPVNSLDPGRNWGVAFFSYTDNERATLAGGAFKSGTSNNTGNDIRDGNDMTYTFRATCLPWYDAASDGRYLWQVGGAFSQRFPPNHTVEINQGPQSSLLPISDNPGSPFLPKISIPSNHWQIYNLGSALVLGALSFQAEWNAAYISQIGGSPVFLNGMYVYASYFLTGENRDYIRKDGAFGGVHVRSPFLCLGGHKKIAHGPGAWELAARFDYTNYNNPNIPMSNGLKVGERLAEFALGVNWWLNDYTRIMFNYLHAVPVDPNFGPSWGDEYVVRCEIFW
jgi:phosphate-selective porin OprO/OprP